MLREAGVKEVVTPGSTAVHVSRFRDVEEVSLAEALARLDPLDPRRDPWMSSLDRFFTIDGRNAVYARTASSAFVAARTVRRALEGRGRVAEWVPARLVAALLLFAAVAAFVLVRMGRERLRVLPALVVWTPAVVLGGLPIATVATTGMIVLAWFVEEAGRVWIGRRYYGSYRLETFRLRALAVGGHLIVSTLYLALIAAPSLVVVLVCASLGALAGCAAVVMLSPRRVDAGHRPFVPVLMLSRGPRVARGWTGVASVAIATLLLVPPAAELAERGAPASPNPRPVSGSTVWERIAALDSEEAEAGSGARLPDLADYVTHRAFQDGILYGRSWGLPEAGETIELIRYREEPDGAYSEFRETVLTFDDAWLESRLDDAPAGVAALLVEVGPAGLVLAPNVGLYSAYPRFMYHLLYVVVLLAPFVLVLLHPAARRHERSTLVELGRRRTQVA